MRPFAIIIELTVARHSLAQAHLLDVGNEQFNLIVGYRRDNIKDGISMSIIHAHDIHESHIVKCLSPTRIIHIKRKNKMGIMKGGIEITVVIGVGEIIQPVRHTSILRRTS